MTHEEFKAWSAELQRRGTRALHSAVVLSVALHLNPWLVLASLLLLLMVAEWRARDREWRRIRW